MGALGGCRYRVETIMHCDGFNSALSLGREQVLVTKFSTWRTLGRVCIELPLYYPFIVNFDVYLWLPRDEAHQ